MTSERKLQKQRIAREALKIQIQQDIIKEEAHPIIPRNTLSPPKGTTHEVVIRGDGTWADIYKSSTPHEEHKFKLEPIILSGPNKNCEDILN